MLGKCLSISHITFYVSNARQMAINYCLQYGFKPFRYRGLENGSRLQTSHAVINNDIVFVFVSPLTNCEDNHPIHSHIVTHGDGVKDVAFNVSSIETLIRHIRQTSGQEVREWHESDKNGSVKFANLIAFGDTTHTLIECDSYPRDEFLPGWTASPLQSALSSSIWSKLPPVNLGFIDHVAANQRVGQMTEVVKWYENVLGFHRFWSADDTIISTHLSGLKSTFMTNQDETIKIPINESGPGSKRSQIQEFLDYNCGPGVQHIALHTENICETVAKLRDRGVEFLSTPENYYQRLSERLEDSKLVIKHDISTLKQLNILIDFDQNGYLLQIFTKPVQDRPTLFLELIERHNYNGFGAGNIKALFEAIESQQNLRGNL